MSRAGIVSKARSTVRFYLFGSIALPLLLAALLGTLTARERSSLLDLKNHGKYAEGRVIAKHVVGGRRRDYILRVEVDADGQRVRSDLEATMEDYSSVQRGDSIIVTYLPDFSEMQIGQVTDEQIQSMVAHRVVVIVLLNIIVIGVARLGGSDYQKARRVLREHKT